ncbi:MAG: YciI family protein [Bacillota bacterium]|nr:YciI family protein [Bacillota bacterium]
MKFYLINGSFRPDMPQGPAFKEALEAHHAYWAPYMQKGEVLVSGPKVGGAGLLLLKCEDDADVQAIMDADPFVSGGVAEFVAMEFNPFYAHPDAAAFFGK